MQPLLLVQPPIEHSRAQLEDLADRLIVGARLRPDDWPILVVAAGPAGRIRQAGISDQPPYRSRRLQRYPRAI